MSNKNYLLYLGPNMIKCWSRMDVVERAKKKQITGLQNTTMLVFNCKRPFYRVTLTYEFKKNSYVLYSKPHS